MHEPNEYHLGYSGRNKGKAVSDVRAEVIYDALRNNSFSRQNIAITNEAHFVLLLVKGIGQDIMSDIIANVCRDILLKPTLKICKKHKISTITVKIDFYNAITEKWETKIGPTFQILQENQLYYYQNLLLVEEEPTRIYIIGLLQKIIFLLKFLIEKNLVST